MNDPADAATGEDNRRISEVTVYSVGDSRLPRTWSNIPFFLTSALEAKGVTVNRVDLAPARILSRLYGACGWVLRLLLPGRSKYQYLRSWLHLVDVRARIRRAVRGHPRAQIELFTTFSFSAAGLSPRPSVLLCDWTYEYLVSHFEKREPDAIDRRVIAREDAQLAASDLVVSLFPEVTDHLQRRHPGTSIAYLGNVVNTLERESTTAARSGARARSLLFIGGRPYLAGARCLIDAFRILRQEFPDLTADIVGMDHRDLGEPPPGMTFHGYLDKGQESQRDLYYSLLGRSLVFVNTTPGWAAFSATIEAMYFHLPVIVTPYEEFVRNFGRDLPFGYYCEGGSVEALCDRVRELLAHPDCEHLRTAAHDAVKDCTWSAFSERLLAHLSALPKSTS